MIHEIIHLNPQNEMVTLTTYISNHSWELRRNQKRPAVIICPGGAYIGHSEGEGEPVALAFARMGYAAFVLNYSIYSEDGGFGALDSAKPVYKEKSVFPRPMLDIGRAMDCIKEHALEWGVDSEKIILCGFSAGGHNVGMYSVYWEKYQLPKPAASILGYAVTDFRDHFPGPMDDWMHMAIGGKCDFDEETYEQLSVREQVNESTPPMFLWATARDRMVPVENTLRLGTRLAELGIPFEMHIFERGPHALSLADDSSSIVAQQSRLDVAAWVELAHTWLRKHCGIELPRG